MGLFSKKNCVICGEKVGMVGGKKIADGHLCKECKKKLSPFFRDAKNATTEQIKEQLAWREENRKNLDSFEPNVIFGESGCILIDENSRRFCALLDTSDGLFKSAKHIESIDEVKDKNPDIISFDDIDNVKIDVTQSRREEKQTIDGEQVSYDPPQYTYMEGFAIEITTHHPYATFMRIPISDGTVQIYNEEARHEDDIITGFIKDRIHFPREEMTESVYTDVTMENVVWKAMQVMPDYSYGFKCTLRNYDDIKKYAYYLALCDEIKRILGK